MTSLFIADLHLHDQRPELTRAFLHFIRHTAPQAQALYILGDLFEAWIGDDDNSATGQQVCTALQQLSAQGVKIYLQHGNRDFLIGERFCHAAGVTLLPETQVINVGDEPVLIMHGDQLCLQDKEYQAFKKQVRSEAWQADFLSKPIDERIAIAAGIRAQSKQEGQYKSDEIMDVTPEEVDRVMREHQVRILIHGHTHRPKIHSLDGGRTRIVLGDWDQHLWYLSCRGGRSLQLIAEPIQQ